MDKIVEHSRLYNLIHKPLVAWTCLYLMSVLGMLCKYYFNLKDSFWLSTIIFILLMVCYGIILVFRAESINEDESEYYTAFYFFACFCFTFVLGLNTSQDKITLIGFTAGILSPFIGSIVGLRLLSDVRDKNLFIYFLCFLVLIGLMAVVNFNFEVFTRIFNIIMGNVNDFFILSLTIILLGATLSLLAFTYYMVLDNNDASKKEMKSIGEHFFISTLFAMFFLIIVFVFVMYCTQSSILSLGNINFIEPSSFIMVNLFAILLFLLAYTLAISLRYLLGGIFASLNNLPFKF